MVRYSNYGLASSCKFELLEMVHKKAELLIRFMLK